MRTIAPFLALLLATLTVLPGCLRDLGVDARPYACRLADPASCGAGWTCVAAAGSVAGEGVCIVEGSLTDDGPAPDPGRDDGAPDDGAPDEGAGPDTCVADCTDRDCGPDGCGGTCGTCDGPFFCNLAVGRCESACTPDCFGRDCGEDGCGGWCGQCGADAECVDGTCVNLPACDDTCMQYQACLRDCGATAECDCDSKLSDKGRERLNAVTKCAAQSCSGASETPAEYESCLKTRCLGDYLACYSGCKHADCFGMTDCIAACGMAGTATCVQDCAWNASVPAQKDLLSATGCDDDECPSCTGPVATDTKPCNLCRKLALIGACRPHWEKCLRYGSRKCSAAFTCLTPNECGETCSAACVRTTSEVARDFLQVLYQCIEDRCPLADIVGWETCVKTATGNLGGCREEYVQCE